MVDMKGTYEWNAADNLDQFLSALGFNMLKRKAAIHDPATPIMTVSEDNGQWTIRSATMLKSMELSCTETKFKLGEEYEETTADGRAVRSITTIEGDKMITVQTAKKAGEKSTQNIKEFSADKCIVRIELIATDVVSTETYVRK